MGVVHYATKDLVLMLKMFSTSSLGKQGQTQKFYNLKKLQKSVKLWWLITSEYIASFVSLEQSGRI